MYSTYILYSISHDRYYIGHCSDLHERLMRHNMGKVISTKVFAPWVLRYEEKYQAKPEAARREREIKSKKSRKYIEWLINRNVQ